VAAAAPTWESFLYGGEARGIAGQGDRVWVASSGGLRVYEPDGAAAHARDLPTDDLPGPALTAVSFAGNALWAAAAGGTVGRFDLDKNTWSYFDESSKLPAADVSQFFYDGEDLWAATRGGGVAQYLPLISSWRAFDRTDGLTSNYVNCITGDTASMWVGTDEGLVRYGRASKAWEAFQGPPNRLQGPITSLAETAHYLWIAAGDEGLMRVRLDNGEFAAYNSLSRDYKLQRVDRLLATADGSLWIAGDGGLIRAEGEGDGKWTPFVRGPWEVSGLTAAGGALWIATRHQGTWRYRPAADEWLQFLPKEPFPSGDLTAMAANGEGAWLGFRDDGLAHYDLSAGRWETLAPKGGWPKQVRDVAAADRFVYVAGADGLACYDQREGTWETRRTADDAQLPGDEWSTVLPLDDRVWCAGPNGVAAFDAQLRYRFLLRLPDLQQIRPESQPRLVPDPFTGDMWVITATEAWRYQRRTNTINAFTGTWLEPHDATLKEREGRVIRDLAADNDCVWIVGLEQVFQYRKQDGSLVVWDERSVPALRDPVKVAADSAAVWVAADTALCRFDRRSNLWTPLAWPDELAGDPVTALTPDGWESYYVWVATPRHVARLDLRAEKPQWTVFPRRAGLVPGVRRIIATRRGVWFLGRGGVTLYRRSQEGLEPR
jgi:ligand-binding sensor domain-containing protein